MFVFNIFFLVFILSLCILFVNLEREGKISEYSKLVGKKRTRVYYHLEPKGKEYLNELLESYQNTTAGINNIFAVLKKGVKTDEQDL